MKNKGIFVRRLKEENPHELAFARAWENQVCNSLIPPTFLNSLLITVSERDKEVAATVIQWLGSNVGKGFLHSVIKDNPALKADVI